jgi:hypothetical protein
MLGRIVGLMLMRGPTLMLGPCACSCCCTAQTPPGQQRQKMLAATSNRTPHFIRMKDRLPGPVSIIWRPRKSMQRRSQLKCACELAISQRSPQG